MGEKTFCLSDKKVKKNQIPKYHAPSHKKTLIKIQDQSIKNFLTQWEIEEENRKIYEVGWWKTS